ncbi:uncharacterized protein Z520_10395 [Fonsecaea multimorphosa CBS 102226]|uniref:endo-1,3(4)-beta-glucanase n=1 Tax=Fonsecaea multimorphosa CBS 102226 TaxID=1442371 RepID=A0A0D2I9B5_9EURO|nr:uncharacterized protein Z520_10395 [Fonsecaea multimorphosa CBS 102226]KIX93771.1 hypothetical protein Z520_10395 [Fonsecaea multimorphosa CBS 102226]OAL19201.1 hypothetical protein AYO22_09962 [Fonsecaea multimorphosa]
MHVSVTTLAILASAASAAYVLEDDYSSSQFADMFDFFTDNDPTNGYVNYISYDEAESSGLYKVDNGTVYMGVDSTNVASGRGRDSLRLSTKKSYNHGLIILDLAHMPAGACGTWPAFWMLGPDWPNNGEVDIIEGVNSQTSNNMAMHTDPGCTITNTGAFSGTLETDDCDTTAPDQPSNAGCSMRSQDTTSFGNGFNSNGGGVYATEWTSEAISIWFFSRDAIPSDISSGNPDTSNWGLPQGQFTGGCDIDDMVKDQQLVFDVTFCGDWAGSVWTTDATCAPLASTCQDYVQNNPSAFQDMYWLINGLQVYTENGAATSASTSTSTPASTATSITATQSVTTLLTITSSSATVVSTQSVEATSISTQPAVTSPTFTPAAIQTSQPSTFITAAPSASSPWPSSGAWSGAPWNTAAGDNGQWNGGDRGANGGGSNTWGDWSSADNGNNGAGWGNRGGNGWRR